MVSANINNDAASINWQCWLMFAPLLGIFSISVRKLNSGRHQCASLAVAEHALDVQIGTMRTQRLTFHAGCVSAYCLSAVVYFSKGQLGNSMTFQVSHNAWSLSGPAALLGTVLLVA